MMAEQADQEIYIYKGGRKEFVPRPRSATHIRVHDSVKVILEDAFYGHRNVVEFECHDGVERIMGYALRRCTSLKRVKIPGVTVIEKYAFGNCVSLTDVVDCDKLETKIGKWAFHKCKSLTCIKMPSIETVEALAFSECKNLNDVECGDKLERFGAHAFKCCTSLKRITIPFKDGMIPDDDSVFQGCLRLERVDLVGGTHKTIAALQLEDWRKDMDEEFDRINQILPNTFWSELHFDRGEKTQAIRIWITSVLRKIREIEFYKAEHRKFLKEASTTLELAVWKSRLCGDNNDVPKGDEKKRAECRNNCGADMSIIIPTVLSFLTKIEATEIEKYVSTRAARCRFELFGF